MPEQLMRMSTSSAENSSSLSTLLSKISTPCSLITTNFLYYFEHLVLSRRYIVVKCTLYCLVLIIQTVAMEARTLLEYHN